VIWYGGGRAGETDQWNTDTNIFDGTCSQGTGPGVWVDGGYNTGSDASCQNGGTGGSTALTSVHLGPLADNGGPTETVLPLAGPALGIVPASTSVTLNGSNIMLCPVTDQRGVTTEPGSCDAGAVQVDEVIDADGDGVLDDVDGCPTDAEDFDGVADGDGCPETDADGDGVLDDVDNCPTDTNPGQADTDGDGAGDACDVSDSIVFSGFHAPVNASPTLNAAKAGQTIPLKFLVTNSSGAPVTTLTSVSVTVSSLACSNGSTADAIEEYSTGASGLQNLGGGEYQFNWKTPKSYVSSCKTLKLDVGDGIAHTALFSFAK